MKQPILNQDEGGDVITDVEKSCFGAVIKFVGASVVIIGGLFFLFTL